MIDFIFDETKFAKAAMKKFVDLPDNFHIYSAEHVSGGMRVIGAEFREAKSGKNKDIVCIKVKGTDRDMFVSTSEINNE